MRLTAAVMATAAVAITIAGASVSAAGDKAVRAEVAVAGSGRPLDVRWIRILDGLMPGESYRLPAVGIRNNRSSRTAYGLVFSAGGQAERRPPRRWLRFVPAAVVVDAGRSRAVGVRLELPDDAEPGHYAVVLGVRPGGSDGVRLSFRVESAETTGTSRRRTASLATWVIPTLVGLVLGAFLVRGQQRIASGGQSASRGRA